MKGGAAGGGRSARLAGDGAREKRFARARRSDEQHASRHAGAEAGGSRRVAEERDDLFELALGFVDAGDVREAGLRSLFGDDLRATARGLHEGRRTPTPERSLHQEEPQAEEECDRQKGARDRDERARRRRALEDDFAGAELGGDTRVDGVGHERTGSVAGSELAADGFVRDDGPLDLPLLEERLELRIGKDARRRSARKELRHEHAEGDGDREEDQELLLRFARRRLDAFAVLVSLRSGAVGDHLRPPGSAIGGCRRIGA